MAAFYVDDPETSSHFLDLLNLAVDSLFSGGCRSE